MKILHTVESYLPARHGMSEVVRQISERLVSRGHQVTVATGCDPKRTEAIIDGVHIREFDVHGKSAIGVWGDVSGYQRFLLEEEPDVIVNFAAQQWATDLALPLLPKLKARKVFVPTGFSALADPMFRGYFSSMKEWMKSYDACVFLSDAYRDIDFARASGVQNIAVIPNGAAEEEFSRSPDPEFRQRFGIPNQHRLLIHVAGYLSVAKGQAEAVEIFSQSSVQDATLLLICPEFSQSKRLSPKQFLKGLYHLARGKGLRSIALPSQLQILRRINRSRNQAHHRQILCLSLSRQDTISAFLDANLLLFPSWIECSPLVLFEAIAAHTPFLVTDVGNAREIIHWTGGGLLLPGEKSNDREGTTRADVKAGAKCLDEVLADPEGLQMMAEQGHEAWRRSFTWNRIADQYESLYERLLSGLSIEACFLPPQPIL